MDVEEQIALGEQLDGVDLHDLDLAGCDLHGRSFHGSIVYGLQLYRSDDNAETEVRTNIGKTDWTDAVVASAGAETFLGRVDAEEAVFGFTESLTDRRQRHAASDAKPTDLDSGGYHNFNGAEGNFRRTIWRNIDFGGSTGYEARFEHADLTDAVFEGCDLTDIDLSTARTDGIQIIHCRTDGLRLPPGDERT